MAEVAEKKKLEAIAYTIAGLDMRLAANRADVSYRSLCTWVKDKKLRQKALAIYMRSIKDARTTRKNKDRTLDTAIQKFEDREHARIASIVARMTPAQRSEFGRKAAAKRRSRVVIVNQVQPVAIIVNDKEDLVKKLQELKDKFAK